MLQKIQSSRGSNFSLRVQWEFRRKYPEYVCYIAAGSDIAPSDWVADTDGDKALVVN